MKHRVLALTAVTLFAIQAAVHISRGQPAHMLWVCNVGLAAVGVGQLRNSAMMNAVGTFWLTVGLPTWIFDLTLGADLIPTSILTHVGGVLIGYAGIRKLGLPSGTWWTSLVTMAVLLVVTRLVTPPELNVNLVYGSYTKTTQIVSSHFWNIALVFAVFTAVFLTLQFGLPKLGWIRS